MKKESRWDQTSGEIRAEETPFPVTIIRYNSFQGCSREYPNLELNKKSGNWQEDNK